MSRIESRFEELKRLNKKALITFVTAGDPDRDTTMALVREMEGCGADIIELGIPYSDPIAEGPIIQAANERALKHSIKIRDILEMTARLRMETQVPIVYLLYFNCILQYGPEKFFRDCSEAGVDGLIIPDLPFEERWELEDLTGRYPLDIITLVAPTSKDRIRQIARDAKGFLYCVSSLGVTGERKEFGTDFEEFFSFINENVTIPKAIGFGISTPEQVSRLKGYSDGLIVGSAIVRLVGESSNRREAVEKVGKFIRELRAALDE